MKYYPHLAEFLRESNAIEGVYGEQALDDAFLAWECGQKRSQLMNAFAVLGIHGHLMANVDSAIAGKWRDRDVWIGGEKKPFISTNIVIARVQDWIDQHWYTANDEEDMRQAHIEFEKIHPFTDGNGRVGRILYNMQRVYAGYPIHVIHTGEEQQEYYRWWQSE